MRRRTRLVGASSLGLLVAFVGAAALVHDPSPRPGANVLGQTILTASTCGGSGTFSVCGPLSGSGPVLYPGASAPNNLPVTFGNPLAADIFVNSLTVYFTNSFASTSTKYPGTCDATALQVNGHAVAFPSPLGSGLGADPYVTVALPGVLVTAGHTTTNNVTLALADNHKNQDDCRNLPLAMTYSATAQYTDGTSVNLASSPNPVPAGSSTKLTATVTAADASSDTNSTDGASNVPTGSANFYQCGAGSTTTSCANPKTELGVATLTSASAGVGTLMTAPLSPAGTYYFQAVYTPPTSTTPDFASSSSNILAQMVTSCTTTITTNTPGNQTVISGQTLCVTGTGTVGGNVTVNSNGTLDLNGGKVVGNVQSSGVLSVTSGSSIGGNLQTNGGGPVNIAGATVGGNLQLQSQTVGPDSICGTSVKGNLQVQSNAGAIQIGGSSACAGNTVGGNLQVQSNSGKVTIGATGYGTTSGGNIQVQSNSGGGSLIGNSAAKNCQLQSDTPPITGSGNTVNGTLQSPTAANSCNKAGGA